MQSSTLRFPTALGSIEYDRGEGNVIRPSQIEMFQCCGCLTPTIGLFKLETSWGYRTATTVDTTRFSGSVPLCDECKGGVSSAKWRGRLAFWSILLGGTAATYAAAGGGEMGGAIAMLAFFFAGGIGKNISSRINQRARPGEFSVDGKLSFKNEEYNTRFRRLNEDEASTPQEVWSHKGDNEVVAALSKLDTYTETGRQVILAEMERRGLKRPDA